MDALFRWCRGALGTGATWGAAWAATFASLVLVIGILDPDSIDPGEGPLKGIAIGALFGFVSGAVFSALVALAEGGKAVRDLSAGRAALWGMLATAAYPLLTAVDNGMLFIVCPVGAALAAASVTMAKKAELAAPPERPELPG
jgi:hypothetical protein